MVVPLHTLGTRGKSRLGILERQDDEGVRGSCSWIVETRKYGLFAGEWEATSSMNQRILNRKILGRCSAEKISITGDKDRRGQVLFL